MIANLVPTNTIILYYKATPAFLSIRFAVNKRCVFYITDNSIFLLHLLCNIYVAHVLPWNYYAAKNPSIQQLRRARFA